MIPGTVPDTPAIARRYDAIPYAAQSNALSHPAHLATVATLFGLAPAPVATCRVLEVGCSDGANLLPMAAVLPRARFVGCDVSPRAIATARAGAAALGLANVALVERDLAELTDEPAEYDYIVAHGIYSWVPAPVRDALLALAARRLARNGVLFVSYNVYPGCHVRQAAWEVLRHHVAAITDPPERVAAARAFAALMAEPGAAQNEADALLRHEFARVAAATDSALAHDDLAVPNDPVYFHEFATHLARHDLAFVAEARLPAVGRAGLSPGMRALVGDMPPLAREQYLDFARLSRFRQSVVCRADAGGGRPLDATRVADMHVAAALPLVRAAAEGKALAAAAESADPNVRALRRVLQWLTGLAPRSVPVAEVADWQRRHAPADAAGARPVTELLAEACLAGSVDLSVQPPAFVPVPSARPVASPLVRWQAARQSTVTNLRHETLRIDDATARALLPLLDGTRSHADLVAAYAATLPPADRAHAQGTVATHLSHFAMHALLAA
ncbi:MAG: methyltransferase regulatory domain-containing protein [Betaproteobacteria bacterium]|nr:methyltransferase regulatory domain-containing protein [Betaproteobacteria bacterium]